MSDVVDDFIKSKPDFLFEAVITPENALNEVKYAFDDASMCIVAEDVADLVDKFAYLFELEKVGVRMRVLDKAMCPKFHVDRVPCRLVTTYQGVATEWLPHEVTDRTKLGLGSQGLEDHLSGLYKKDDDIQKLQPGDVGLLKGTNWEGNEAAGLVHRSPTVDPTKKRLLVTMDFVN